MKMLSINLLKENYHQSMEGVYQSMAGKKTKQSTQTQTQSILDRYESNRDDIIRLSREIADLKHQMIKLLTKDTELFNQIREAHDNQR